MSQKYNEYLKTDYWKAVQKAVKARFGWRCAICNSPHDLDAHHRTYEHRGNELDHLDDLVALCRRCHRIFHKGEDPAGKIVERIIERIIEKPEPRLKSVKEPRIEQFTEAEIEAQMPAGDPITLSVSLIKQCRTSRQGFTNATIRAFGLNRSSMTKGWPHRLSGTVISRDRFRDALKGRFVFNSAPLAKD